MKSFFVKLRNILLGKLRLFLVRVIPLPPLEQRTDGLMVHMKALMPSLRLSNEPDYIMASATLLLLKLSVAALLLIILDVSFRVGFLIDPVSFDEKKLLLPIMLRNIMLWPSILICIVFYLRVRLKIDLRNDWIPILGHPGLLSDPNPKNWFKRSVFVVFIGIIMIPFNHLSVFAAARYFRAEDDVGVILCLQILQILAITGAAVFLPMGLLLAEKSYRFFPDLQKQLAVLVAERDQKTDKYRNNHKKH